MQSFEYYSPTEIVFGKGAESKTADKIMKHGGSRVFIVYGGGSRFLCCYLFCCCTCSTRTRRNSFFRGSCFTGCLFNFRHVVSPYFFHRFALRSTIRTISSWGRAMTA